MLPVTRWGAADPAPHDASTVIVGLNGLRLLRQAAWRGAAVSTGARLKINDDIQYDAVS
jgi:hypothetical protein